MEALPSCAQLGIPDAALSSLCSEEGQYDGFVERYWRYRPPLSHRRIAELLSMVRAGRQPGGDDLKFLVGKDLLQYVDGRYLLSDRGARVAALLEKYVPVMNDEVLTKRIIVTKSRLGRLPEERFEYLDGLLYLLEHLLEKGGTDSYRNVLSCVLPVPVAKVKRLGKRFGLVEYIYCKFGGRKRAVIRLTEEGRRAIAELKRDRGVAEGGTAAAAAQDPP